MPSVNHIVLLSPGFARDEEDSTCLPFLQDYSLAFHRLHPEVDLNIVTLQYPFDRAAYFWKGVPVYSAQGRNNRFPFRFGTWYKVWKQLNKLHRAKKINVLHTFWLTEATLIGKLFCRLKGIKLVAYSIGQDTLPQNKYLKLLGLRKDEIITMSQRLRDNLSGLGIPSGKIIPLGIELLKFSTQKGDRTLDLIGIGALTELKNYSLFIDLVAALRETHPAIRTEIIGEGPQESLLRQQILNLGLSGQITLAGKVPHAEIHSRLGKARILLHTSRFEGQSTVMMEALACGTHVVCFDVGRLDEPTMIHACQTKQELISTLLALLGNANLSHTPVVLQTTEQMVKAFWALYRE